MQRISECFFSDDSKNDLFSYLAVKYNQTEISTVE